MLIVPLVCHIFYLRYIGEYNDEEDVFIVCRDDGKLFRCCDWKEDIIGEMIELNGLLTEKIKEVPTIGVNEASNTYQLYSGMSGLCIGYNQCGWCFATRIYYYAFSVAKRVIYA